MSGLKDDKDLRAAGLALFRLPKQRLLSVENVGTSYFSKEVIAFPQNCSLIHQPAVMSSTPLLTDA